MSISESIIVGVVSGLITSAFLYLLYSLFQKIVLPWYQTLIYKGIVIDGEWHCMNLSQFQDAHLSISQKANRLRGSAAFVDHNPGTKYDSIRTFTLTGEIGDRFVRFSLKHTDKNRLGASTYLFQVSGDGTELKGAHCYYSIDSSQILSSSVTFVRTNNARKDSKKTA